VILIGDSPVLASLKQDLTTTYSNEVILSTHYSY
jgi:hypothetical protein